jgi:hypothetical protein
MGAKPPKYTYVGTLQYCGKNGTWDKGQKIIQSSKTKEIMRRKNKKNSNPY